MPGAMHGFPRTLSAVVLAFGLLASIWGCDRISAFGQGKGSPQRGADAPRSAAASGPKSWTLEYESIGLAQLRRGSADIVDVKYLFFGPPWNWERHDDEESESKGQARDFSVAVPGLGVQLAARVSQTGPNELSYDYDVTIGRKLEGIGGGGLEWKLNYQSLAQDPGFEKPELLDGGKGFRWQVADGQVIEVSFEPAPPLVHFEAGQPNVIRTFFVGRDAKPGKHHYRMKVRAPAGGRVVESLTDRYADSGPTWHPDTLRWDAWPVDLRFLNEGHRPAGKHGMVGVQGDQLVFADKTPARFWGTNIQALAIFGTNKDQICHQAKRIAAFGYNLVRIHHHDSHWVKPNIFEANGTTQQLNPQSLDAIDWWIQCLAEQGVYTFLDLNVGRLFLPGDNVPGIEEITPNLQAKGLGFVNPRIEALMQRFARDYMGHKNPYRDKRYADDPAIAAVMITNENDLIGHFVHRLQPGKGNPEHGKMLEEAFDKFTKAHGLASVDLKDAWRPGNATLALAGIESTFFERAIADLRNFGVRVPIVTSNYWGNEPFAVLPALTTGNLIDAHSYGDAEYLSEDPRVTVNYLAWVAPAQIAGKPLAISEWALEHDRQDRFVAPLHFAAIASLQGWDMPMHFTYQQVPFQNPQRVQAGSNSYDPGIMAMMPAAALLFRRQDARPAAESYVLKLSRKDVFEDRRSPKDSVAVRTLVERSKLSVALPTVPELPNDKGASIDPSARIITDLDRDFVPEGQDRIVSDTGELMHDWRLGYHTVDTPRTQGAAGWLGGVDVALKNVTFRLKTPKAAIALSSLDDQPIERSQNILLSAVAQVEADGDGRLPYRAEPIRGEIALKNVATQWTLVPISPDGSRHLTPIKPQRNGAEQVFKLAGDAATHWYLLKAEGSPLSQGAAPEPVPAPTKTAPIQPSITPKPVAPTAGAPTPTTGVAAPTTTLPAQPVSLPPVKAPQACGEKGQPMCPLQGWMEKNLQPALEAKDLVRMAQRLRRAAAFAPTQEWNAGATSWRSIAEAGAASASRGDFDGARQSCKSCHSTWRSKYKASFRQHPIAP